MRQLPMEIAATRSARRATLMRRNEALGASDTTSSINKTLREQDLDMIRQDYDLTLTPYQRSAVHTAYCKALGITEGASARERALSAREYYRLKEDPEFYYSALEAADVLLELIIDEQDHHAVPAIKIGAMQKECAFCWEKEKMVSEMAGLISCEDSGLWVSEQYQPTKIVALPTQLS